MYPRQPPQIEMTPDGRFRDPPSVPLATRIARTAVVVAALTGALAVFVLMLWFALALIPIAIGAGLVAWAAIRFQLWRMRRAGAANAGARSIYRP
jgi:hypothetical protein